MITVETINPIYSNADGKKTLFQKFKEKKDERATKTSVIERKKARADRKSNRKAKRNARKLERAKTPQGDRFLFKLIALVKKGDKAEKTNPDGTKQEIPAKDILSTPQGDFDKKEVSKATGIPEEQITPLVFKKASVITPSGEVKVIVPDSNVATDNQGVPYIADDLQLENEQTKDVAKEEVDSRKPLKKYEKIILYGGIALVVIIGGIIAYKKFKK